MSGLILGNIGNTSVTSKKVIISACNVTLFAACAADAGDNLKTTVVTASLRYAADIDLPSAIYGESLSRTRFGRPGVRA